MKRFTIIILFTQITLFSCGKVEDSTSSSDSSSSSSTYVSQIGSTTASSSSAIQSAGGGDSCSDVVVDANKNVYCAGTTSGSLAENNGGSNDAVVIKFDSSGKVVWATQIGSDTQSSSSEISSASGNDSCLGIALDSDGNVYCGGTTTGSLAESNGGSNDMFVIKLNSSGQLIWATQIGSDTRSSSSEIIGAGGYDKCNSIAVDSSGNVYCGGGAASSFSEVSGGGGDAVVIKLNSSGALVWARQLGSTTQTNSSEVNDASGNDSCLGIDVDSSGNVYCGGTTDGNLAETNAGSGDVMVFKMDSSGSIVWVSQIGTATKASSSDIIGATGSDLCRDVAVDANQNTYCGGRTTSSFSESNVGGGTADLIIAKFDSSGDLLWGRQVGDNTKSSNDDVIGVTGNEECLSIAIDDQGAAYCGGVTSKEFADTNGTGSGSTGEDIIGVKYNSSGDLIWAKQVGTSVATSSNKVSSASGAERCYGVDVDSSGNLYCTGSTSSSLGESNGSSTADIYVIKVDSSGDL